MKCTGAQALIKSLEMEGVEVMFGLPGRRDPPGLRPADRLLDPPHPRPPRAGRRPHGLGLRARHRPPGRLHGDERPGGDERRHRACATPTWTRCRWCASPARSRTRSSAPTRSRRPTRSASRCPSRSTTGSSPTRTTSRASSVRRSTSRRRAGPAPSSSTSRRTSPTRPMEWYWPEVVDLPGYKPTIKGHPKQVKDAARLINEAQRPVIYAGGGILNARASAALREARGGDRYPRRDHVDGAGRVPRRPRAVPRHARHARQLHRRHVDAEGATCSSRWAPASTTASPARSARSHPTRRSSTSTSTPPSSARCVAPTCRSSATAASSSKSW